MKHSKSVKWVALIATAAGAAAAAKKIIDANREGFWLPDGFVFTAHAGCEGSVPNTLESLDAALRSGAPVLEVDVSDYNGEPVLNHNPDTSETDLPLRDALLYIRGRSQSVRVNLDMKTVSHIGRVAEILRETEMTDRCFFTGITEKDVPAVQKKAADIPYYLNFEPDTLRLFTPDYCNRVAEAVEQSGAVGLNCDFKRISKTLREALILRGLQLSVWTVDSKAAWLYVLGIAPHNITTRYPAALGELLDKREHKG